MILPNRRTRIQLLLLVMSFFCIGWADNWQELKTTAGTITSVQAQFLQEKHLPILVKPLISKGAFYFKAPQSLRWEYQSPVQSILTVCDGHVQGFVSSGNGFHKEEGSGLEAMQIVVEEITKWLSGHFNDDPMFQAQIEPGKRIVLVPKQAAFQKVIERIVLDTGSQPGVMRRVTIYESADAFTVLTFKNTVINAKINDSLFHVGP
ncbi:MAG: outer membrane lipoprotein carrier protein LolA [Syntrophobacteraceae bacterium]